MKILDLLGLTELVELCKSNFAAIIHKHKIEDIEDYTVDGTLSATSTNPIQNKVVNSALVVMATDLDKIEEKLDTIEEGANKIIIDSALNDTSSNPVENKVIKAEIDAINDVVENKADSSHTHDDAYYTKTEMDAALSATKEKDLIVTYKEGSAFRSTHTSQEIMAAVNNGQTVKFRKDAELLDLLESDASYATFYITYVNINNKLQQKIVVISGDSVALEQDDIYDYATSDILNTKQDKITGTEGQIVQFDASAKLVAVDPVFITVEDIDVICGGSIEYAEEVLF